MQTLPQLQRIYDKHARRVKRKRQNKLVRSRKREHVSAPYRTMELSTSDMRRLFA